MALKFMVDSLEGLDESIAKLYTEKDGKFYLDVDGAVSKSKLDEFRTNNIQLMKDLERFKDVDPEKYAELLAKQQELDGKKMISMDEVNNMVMERVQTMQTDFSTKEKELQDANAKLNSQLETLLIDSAVRRDASTSKVLSHAVDDVLLRAKTVFTIKDGNPVPLDKEGNVIYGKDGSNPMTTTEWVQGLAKTAPHLFEGSSGGGSGGGSRTGSNLDPSKMSAQEKIKAGLEERANR